MLFRKRSVGQYDILIKEIEKELKDCDSLDLGSFSEIFERGEFTFYKNLLEMEGFSVEKVKVGWLSYNIIIKGLKENEDENN